MEYSDDELEVMLLDLESDSVERKESFGGDAPTKVREAICAFANDLPDRRQAGVVFIGAKDDGSASGLAVTDELLRQLADIMSDGNILPPPTITVTKRSLRESALAVITVPPSDSPPVRCKGRIYVRTGPRKSIATSQDERILNERRRNGDRPYDSRPVPSASLEDLDRRFFEGEYLPSAFAADILLANDRSYEERLAATKMIASAAEPIPTVLGLLVVGKRTRDLIPGAYIQFLRIEGVALDQPVIDEQFIEGTVTDLITKIESKLASHNRTAVEFTNTEKERRVSLATIETEDWRTRCTYWVSCNASAWVFRRREGTWPRTAIPLRNSE